MPQAQLITVARAQQAPTLKHLDPDWLLSVIKAISTSFETWTRRVFLTATHAEVSNGEGLRSLFIKNPPITTLTSVVVTASDGTEETYALTDHLAFDPNVGEIRFNPSASGAFTAGFQNVAANYVGGWAIIPEPVQEACVHLVKSYIGRAENAGGYSKEKLGDWSGETTDANKDFEDVRLWPREVRLLLAPYRIHGV